MDKHAWISVLFFLYGGWAQAQDLVFHCQAQYQNYEKIYMPKNWLRISLSKPPVNEHVDGWDGFGLLLGEERDKFIMVSWLDPQYVRDSLEVGEWLENPIVHFKMSHIKGNNPSVQYQKPVDEDSFKMSIDGVTLACQLVEEP